MDKKLPHGLGMDKNSSFCLVSNSDFYPIMWIFFKSNALQM